MKFRKNVTTLPGKPDFVLGDAGIAVFVDGDFWHGRNWKSREAKLRRGSNADYWIAKIKGNMTRDRRNRAALLRAGWRVVSVWESMVHRDSAACALKIQRAAVSVSK